MVFVVHGVVLKGIRESPRATAPASEAFSSGCVRRAASGDEHAGEVRMSWSLQELCRSAVAHGKHGFHVRAYVQPHCVLFLDKLFQRLSVLSLYGQNSRARLGGATQTRLNWTRSAPHNDMMHNSSKFSQVLRARRNRFLLSGFCHQESGRPLPPRVNVFDDIVQGKHARALSLQEGNRRQSIHFLRASYRSRL